MDSFDFDVISDPRHPLHGANRSCARTRIQTGPVHPSGRVTATARDADGEMIGAATARLEDGTAVLEGIGVREQAAGQGLGAALLRSLAGALEHEGAASLRLAAGRPEAVVAFARAMGAAPDAGGGLGWARIATLTAQRSWVQILAAA